MKRIINRQQIFGIIFSSVFFFGLLFHFFFYRNILINEHENHVKAVIENLKITIDSTIHEKEHSIEHTAEVVKLGLLDESEILELLQSTMALHPDFFSIYIGFPNNTMINATGFDPYASIPNFDVRLRPWYLEAIEKQTTITTNPFVNSSNDYVIITIATPIYADDDTLIGVLAGDLIVNQFLNVLQDSQITDNSYSFAITKTGEFLSHPTYSFHYDSSKPETNYISTVNITSLSNKSLEVMFANDTGVIPIVLEHTQGFIVYTTLATNEWIVGSFIPTSEYNYYLDQFIEIFLITMLGVAAVSAVFFAWQRKHLTTPMISLEREVADINLDQNIEYRLQIPKKDAFNDVRIKVNQLLDTTQEFFEKVDTDNKILSTSNEVLENTLVALRQTEDELRKQYDKLSISEGKYKSLVASMSQGIVLFDVIIGSRSKVEDAIIIDANESFANMIEQNKDDLMNVRLLDVMPGQMQFIKSIERVILSNKNDRFEYYDEKVRKYFEIIVYQVSENKVAAIVIDITIRKKLEEKLINLSFRDQLTELFNRRSYEDDLKQFELKEQFPFTIVMADVNGLKLVNDSFGHDEGDKLLKKVAQMLSKNCSKFGSIYRIGGDEFIIALPRMDYFEADEMIKKLKKLFSKEKISGVEISVSFGWATRDFASVSMAEVIKRAEDNMYKNKLYESPGMRGKAIDTVIDTLYLKSTKEKDHALGVQNLLEKFAIALNLPSSKVLELKKAGKLTDIEMIEIKRHPEVGYRILSAVPEFSEISQYILAHHEKWDGSGYPKGLKKDEIPFESRMMAICDAYYAMTSARTYKPKLTVKEAIQELKRCAGSQFDPFLVTEFVTKVLGSKEEN
jgi:diguanylate cyclase (GGDEF)-like protein